MLNKIRFAAFFLFLFSVNIFAQKVYYPTAENWETRTPDGGASAGLIAFSSLIQWQTAKIGGLIFCLFANSIYSSFCFLVGTVV